MPPRARGADHGEERAAKGGDGRGEGEAKGADEDVGVGSGYSGPDGTTPDL